MPFLAPVVPAILTAATIVQAGLGIISSIQERKTAKAVGKAEAAEIRADAKREAEALAIERRRLLGRQAVMAAAGGVIGGLGSPLDVQLETLGATRKELEDIMLTSERRVRTAKLTAAIRGRHAAFSGIGAGLGGIGSLATRSVGGKPLF